MINYKKKCNRKFKYDNPKILIIILKYKAFVIIEKTKNEKKR